MKIEDIKHLSFYGFATLLGGFALSVAILIGLLFNYEAIRQDRKIFTDAYGAVLRLKDDSESLLTSNTLDAAKLKWHKSVGDFDHKLDALAAVEFPKGQQHIAEIRRLWRIGRAEAADIQAQLQDPEFDTAKNLGKPILRRAGENFTQNATSSTYVTLYKISNAIEYLTQYETFIIQEFNALLELQESEEARRLSRIKSLTIVLPASVLCLSVLLSVVIARWMDRIERQLRNKEQELRQLNENLQAEVQGQLAEIRQKEQILIQQSKLAAMGEMLGNIAHQWRQPLNTLGILIQDTLEAQETGELDRAYLEDTVGKCMRLLDRMSNTINDFRTFFKPGKKPEMFSVSQAVDSALSIVEATLRSHAVQVEKRVVRDAQLLGYLNEYEQVVLNLLSNARDALEGLPPGQAREILIEVEEGREGKSRLSISDSGGGIPAEIMDRIFEPYFTTKFKAQGTGIGLYMAKMIIETNMRGRIWAENTARGAKFVIEV